MSTELPKKVEVYVALAVVTALSVFFNNSNVDDVREKDLAQDADIAELKQHAASRGHPHVQTENIASLEARYLQDIQTLEERIQYLERLLFQRELMTLLPQP